MSAHFFFIKSQVEQLTKKKITICYDFKKLWLINKKMFTV